MVLEIAARSEVIVPERVVAGEAVRWRKTGRGERTRRVVVSFSGSKGEGQRKEDVRLRMPFDVLDARLCRSSPDDCRMMERELLSGSCAAEFPCGEAWET